MNCVVDRTGTSSVIQETPDNLRLLRVNGQCSEGEVLEEGIRRYEKMVTSHSGVWLTNGVAVNGTEFAAKFCSAEKSVSFPKRAGLQ